jgi:hypothetical protein
MFCHRARRQDVSPGVSADSLDKGAHPNASPEIDGDGFGGHTPLFNTVVTLARAQRDRITALLLGAGADPDVHRAG